MFQHLFDTMNEMLDQLICNYPNAVGAQKLQYEEQIQMLKQMSDSLVEQWIDFEEKLSGLLEWDQNTTEAGIMAASAAIPAMAVYAQPLAVATVEAGVAPEAGNASDQQLYDAELNMEVPYETAELLSKGQGYYKLFMFTHAASQFQTAVSQIPECNLARLFLAMTYMHLQEWSEAQRHFQLLVALTDYPKWRALGYNALGCIQAVHMNLEHAEQFFLKAHETCPSFKDSLTNLKCCKETPQQLSLFFGSTELCCL
ncbi:hypothetical protein [Paenibacillus radicis (ex Gao et al. 2016)]|uniref:Tetratricopeptide repeat protein n=1 Tax=Paenibacillus radicis (ex Gao et al. 2016) TaxID=1737354 RepID=A0A917LVW6_9BACL|nr:hypothetical protein [Paenibacillus radicis (ex Gao et al. 2016)]GGG58509.1 hypothetical protein GCM10010918_09530 [Paenibacillus radicis (ex Gao et al. 2016)]